MRALEKFRILFFMVGLACLPIAPAAAATVKAGGVPVVVLPLQELGERRNEINVPFTVVLADRLRTAGNEITRLDALVAFLSNNRIRTAGHLESYHLMKVREELGAPLVLIGAITQKKERPEPSVGVTLALVRTADARTVWSYTRSLGTGDSRRALGIGEPSSVAELWSLLLEDIVEQWPWEIISEAQVAYQVNIDSFSLRPAQLPPGAEVSAWVRLRSVWPEGREPRIFFKADDQLYTATKTDDGGTYEATWVAGDKNGNFPVTLILDWPIYGRRESALLGNYVVDGTPPLFEVDLRGIRMYEGVPVFRDRLVVVPKPVIRKPLDRWRISFYDEDGALLADEVANGNWPGSIIWRGETRDGMVGDGDYKVVLEAWDKAGNLAKVEQQVTRLITAPSVDLVVGKSEESMVVDLQSDSRVPLAFWRMEMWTKEGKMLTDVEGKELPAQVGIDLPATDQDLEIRGFVVMQDVLGNKTRRSVEELLPKIAPKSEEVKKAAPAGVSESWVDGF